MPLSLIIGFITLYVVDTKPWKAKDPSNPRFDVTKFDPNDYRNGEELAPVLGKLLKPNVTTPYDISMIWCKKTPCGWYYKRDGIVDGNTVKCLSPIEDNQKFYVYLETGKSPFFGAWDLWAKFNSDDKLVNACIRDVRVFNGEIPQ